jgi:hypothetical protein
MSTLAAYIPIAKARGFTPPFGKNYPVIKPRYRQVTHPCRFFLFSSRSIKSSPKSSHVMMTSHHISRYLLVVGKKWKQNFGNPSISRKWREACMSEKYNGSELYEIRLKGHLDDRWADRFDGLTISLEENGNTLLTGLVVDQAALHGLLKRFRDLGMILVSVGPVEPGPSGAERSNVKS